MAMIWSTLFARLPLTELLKENSTRKSISTDSNAFEDTVAFQLVKNQQWLDQSGLKDRTNLSHTLHRLSPDFLLSIGYDASNEIRIGVLQCAHQVIQLFFVKLSDSSEHASFDVTLQSRGGFVRNSSGQTDNLR